MNRFQNVEWILIWVAFTLVILTGCESSMRSDLHDSGSDADAWSVEPDAMGAPDDIAPLEDAFAADIEPADATNEDAISIPEDVAPADPDASSTDTVTPDPDPDPDPNPDPDPDPTPTSPPAAYMVEMTYMTANIGRTYSGKPFVQGVFNRIGDNIGPRSGPKFIGWQEINEDDPCGSSCEIDALRNRFKADWGWTTRHPRGQRPNGQMERAKVPITSKGVASVGAGRAKFASPGWAGVSPTRFVTVVRYGPRNLSVINTHFIAGAWSCKSNPAQRRDYWRRAWRVLKDEVAREHGFGHNVVVTGDLNRPRGANNCNPAWQPASLHPRARIIGGSGIDYIYAVPAAGYKFVIGNRANGSAKKGTVQLNIDSHQAHWVAGRFRPQ